MNSSANPRKFAEKIAKLHQKEAEQTMAFEQIMAEVINATRVPTMGNTPQAGPIGKNDPNSIPYSQQQQQQQHQQHLHVNQSVITSRAGSLPNVSNMYNPGTDSSGIDLQSALSNLEEIKSFARGSGGGHRERRHTATANAGHLNSSHVRGPGSGHHEPRSITQSSERTRRASPASPYSTPYLSPPETWRRTNSDSALHQSSMMASSHHQHHNFNHHLHHQPPFLNSTSAAGGDVPPPQQQFGNIDTYDHQPIAQLQQQQLHFQQLLTQSTRKGATSNGSTSLNDVNSEGGGDVGQVMSLGNGQGVIFHQQIPQSAGSSWNHLQSMGIQASHEIHQGYFLDTNGGLRPKSCDVPGITIYPSPQDQNHHHHGNHPQVHHLTTDGHHPSPITANTGSLPDLTNFHFPAPLTSPIDQDDVSSGNGGVGTPSAASNSHSSSFQFNQSAGSPYANTRPPPSPYSVNSNPNSPFSPQSPMSGAGGGGGGQYCQGLSPTAPQTPNSIPDIVLTEPLIEADGILGGDGRPSSGMDNFDTGELFGGADSFQPVDLIDFDGLQILTDMPDSPGQNGS